MSPRIDRRPDGGEAPRVSAGPRLALLAVSLLALLPMLDAGQGQPAAARPSQPTPPFPTLIPTEPLPTLPPSVPTPAPFTPTATRPASATPIPTEATPSPPPPSPSPSLSPTPTSFLGLSERIWLPFAGLFLDFGQGPPSASPGPPAHPSPSPLPSPARPGVKP